VVACVENALPRYDSARISPRLLYRVGLAAYLYCLAIELWHTATVLHTDYVQTAAYHAASWNVSNYFVSYSGGFVRRGLPGAAFSLFATPNKSSAFTMFWVLTALSYAGVLGSAFVITRVVARSRYRPFVWLIVLISPFALNALAASKDNAYLGRYDAISAVSMLALVFVGRRVSHPVVAVAAMTLLVSVATLSEEFTFAFMVPVLLACAYRVTIAPRDGLTQRRLDRYGIRLLAIPLVSGAIFALWSLVARVPQSTIDRAQKAVGGNKDSFDAASALNMSLSEERRFINAFGLWNVNFSIGMWCILFLTICAALSYLIQTQRRWYWASAAYCAVVACAISQFGIDFRRWWLLALTAQLATAALLWPAESPEAAKSSRRVEWVRRLLVAAVLVGCVSFQLNPGVFHPYQLATSTYWKGTAAYWVPGHHGIGCFLHLSSSQC
jgi:hypothetical protein